MRDSDKGSSGISVAIVSFYACELTGYESVEALSKRVDLRLNGAGHTEFRHQLYVFGFILLKSRRRVT